MRHLILLSLAACTATTADPCGAPGSHSSVSPAGDCACDSGYTWADPSSEDYRCTALAGCACDTDATCQIGCTCDADCACDHDCTCEGVECAVQGDFPGVRVHRFSTD